jgi:hypothetical protein
MAIPDFRVLSAVYPDYWKYPEANDARKLVGGEALDSDIHNTCAIRLSHAMNMADVPIPQVWETILNRRGKNKKYYIIRVLKFRSWMVFQFGKPDYDFVKKPGDKFDRKRIEGTDGVILFDIGFKDATGHVDLWYQNKFSHEHNAGKDYFLLADRISLWSTGIRTTSPEV